MGEGEVCSYCVEPEHGEPTPIQGKITACADCRGEADQ